MIDHHQPHSPTPDNELEQSLQDLASRREFYSNTSIADRIELVESCIEGVGRVAREWGEANCRAKAIPAGSPVRGEEILTGPMATLRYLQLLRTTLRQIQRDGRPCLSRIVGTGEDGRCRVRVIPAKGLFDSITFAGFTATVWMQEGVTSENLSDHVAGGYRADRPTARIAVVLGAGNVSSIPATDTLSKLFHDGDVVLLKMSPVNDYLGPIFSRAFSSLIEKGLLRIVYGGAEVGAAAVEHPLVDSIHITGSHNSFERIVWGPPGPESEQRHSHGTPLLKKHITSELGNVSPWIVVPGEYSRRQLAYQAENIAASVVNNASFNCVATKVLVTWKDWPQRTRFLDLLSSTLDRVPKRVAYYPGAMERFSRFAGDLTSVTDDGRLPWTFHRGIDPDEAPRFFQEESFVCVFVEVELEAPTAAAFLEKAVEFCNERLFGTLGAAITLPKTFRRMPSNERLFQSCLARLRYGAIGVNHWPGLMYALMSPPWGGHPGSTLECVQSGLGWVHNTMMLDKPEKTILEGPLTSWPKPVQFSSHRRAESVAWALVRLYRRPTLSKIPAVIYHALRG